ncbi:MAG: ATP-binding cassette domain-containing protein [Lachnospiraceae bacterium]
MLKVENLVLSFVTKKNEKRKVINDISFEVNRGEIVGVVGESGSGKSVTALAVMGLIPDNGVIEQGRITFDSHDMVGADMSTLSRLRGNDICMIFQEPLTCLNPTMKIGRQADEVLRLHTGMGKDERRKKVLQSFASVGLKEPERVYDVYPHQLSGGMRQRVMIAMAVMMEPKLLIADEPTTAIDVTTQRQILKLISEVSQRQQMAVLFITHDLKLAQRYCRRIIVMKDGQIVESGCADDVFNNPQHEYTKKLVGSVLNRIDRKR